MSAVAIQALVVLALIPPATVLLHRGIERDVRRYEQRLRMAELVRAATAMAPHLRRLAEALHDFGIGSALAARRLNRWAAASDLSPTTGVSEETLR